MNFLKGSILFIPFLFAGCAVPPKHPPAPISKPDRKVTDDLWKQHQQKLSTLQNWQAEGRLAAAQGQKGGNASFVWQQRGESYQIKLFGPFGAGAVYITGRPNHVELKEANGNLTSAASPELLMHKVSGWTVPITGLRYWLRGLPTPQDQTAQQLLNQQGQLSYLQQQGWKIDYENYADNLDIPLPNKLRLHRGDIKLKMVVTSWQAL